MVKEIMQIKVRVKIILINIVDIDTELVIEVVVDIIFKAGIIGYSTYFNLLIDRAHVLNEDIGSVHIGIDCVLNLVIQYEVHIEKHGREFSSISEFAVFVPDVARLKEWTVSDVDIEVKCRPVQFLCRVHH